MADLLPPEAAARRALTRRVLHSFELCGYELVTPPIIERGAENVNSRVVGPAHIGSGTRFENSYVGPFTSVASDCVIVDSDADLDEVEPELRADLSQAPPR